MKMLGLMTEKELQTHAVLTAMASFCLQLQGGKLGAPTMEELQFAGILHLAIEQGSALPVAKKWQPPW
jgi:hypothetical protein